MRKVTILARVLLGVIFLGAGVTFFFMDAPPPMEGPAGDFFKGMMATGYFFYLLKITEIVCGALLLVGMFVPLALVVLAPIVINILMVHIFMMQEGLPVALVVTALTAYLAFFSAEYSPRIKLLFK